MQLSSGQYLAHWVANDYNSKANNYHGSDYDNNCKNNDYYSSVYYHSKANNYHSSVYDNNCKTYNDNLPYNGDCNNNYGF